MKILFLMLQLAPEGKGGGMYENLAVEFAKHGHSVTVIAPDVDHARTFMGEERGLRVLRVGSMATQGVKNMIKKGIALALLPKSYKKAYNKYLKKEKFDWIFMPTPPITLSNFVGYVKKYSGAKFYLILRDIHPQSVASIGLLKFKWMYNYLDRKARCGYANADLIGCMSQGNIDFVASQYPDLDRKKLVLLYNWLERPAQGVADSDIRSKFGLSGKFVALFGGTIGYGQRIENIVFLAEHYKPNDNIVFLVIGKGVEKVRLESIAKEKSLTNIRFIDFMPQQDYLNFVKSVDLGLVTINERYRVPTCPSKAVSYMSLGIPVFAMINPNSDYGQVIENAGAGYWTVGSDKERTIVLFDKIYQNADLRKKMGECGLKFYNKNCTVEVAYSTMMQQMEGLDNA